MKRALRTALLLAATLLGSAVAQAQTCPAGYPRSTPDSDFADAGSGTVRHIPTGLIWKRCAEGQDWNGSTCTGSTAGYTWEQAFARAAAVNAGQAGTWNASQTDWRVPNINELKSIVEEGCYNPAINATQFPATPASFFWSGSPFASSSGSAWLVYFGSGNGYWDVRGDANLVRLVRGGQYFYNFDAGVTHAVTASAGTGGSASCTPNPAAHGGTSICTATANAGYAFAAWTGDCAGQGASCTLSNITAAKSVTASFITSSGVQGIPTLSEWGMIILSLLLAGMTAFRLRRG